MTRAEWLASDDPVAMLEALRANWRGEEADLVRLNHRYLLACCRAIWPLLPLEASRRGVEVAERYLEGRATKDEFADAEYQAEGAAFFLEPVERRPEEEEPRYQAERMAQIEQLGRDLEAVMAEELRRMVGAAADDTAASRGRLLCNAAYFADFAMVYPGVRPREGAIERHSQFLSASLLRELVGSVFRPEGPGHERIR